MTPCSIAFRSDETSDCGPRTVSSDHQCSRHLTLRSEQALRRTPAHPTLSALTDEVHEARVEGDLSTSFSRSVDKQRVYLRFGEARRGHRHRSEV